MTVALSLLIVEDSDDDARLVVRHLERGGYALTWELVDDAPGMAAALDRRSWDLIIADYAMPRFSALAAFAQVQQRQLDVPFIIFSGSIGEDIAVAAMRAGVHDYILKHNASRLLPAIARELRDAAGRRLRRQAEIALQRSEDDRSRLIAELQAAVQMRDEFLSVASHELRTPVTSLQLLVDSLVRRQERHPSLSQVPEWLHAKHVTMARQIRRLSRLINELLDLSRIGAVLPHLEMEALELVSVTSEVVALFTEELEDAHCEVRILTDGPVWGRWDRLHIEQILSQMITNAMKYGAGKPIELEVGGDAGQATCTVRDAGIGIAVADQARIFERFVRAASVRHFGGLGLGLWIARELLAQMGGTISVTSQPGAGAAFTVCLPRLAPLLGEASPETAETGGRRSRGGNGRGGTCSRT